MWVRLSNNESIENFNLSINETKAINFNLKAPENSQKLTYGIHHETGRALQLGDHYLGVKPEKNVFLRTDKSIYNLGENVTLYVELDSNSYLENASLTINSDFFSDQEVFSELNITYQNEFTLPSIIRTGSYEISYVLQGINLTEFGEIAFDVKGYGSRFLKAELDNDTYGPGENATIKLDFENNGFREYEGELRLWVYDPNGLIYTDSKPISLDVSDTNEAKFNFSVGSSGMNSIVYGIYLNNTRLASGTETFDVRGPVILGITTDKTIYEQDEPVIIRVEEYSFEQSIAPLNVEVVSHNSTIMLFENNISINEFSFTDVNWDQGKEAGFYEIKASLNAMEARKTIFVQQITDSDNDGISDEQDNCPNDENADQVDFDSDGQGDVCDADDDGDGVDDVSDVFPFDPTEWSDNDGDGVGDIADADNDGQKDVDELACGSDPLNSDSRVPDFDGDNAPDCLDTDDDNDGYDDVVDAFPFDSTEWVDNDGDGMGNNADLDDDDDGQTDSDEVACGSNPLDALSLSLDTDGDGLPNCLDEDDDNDGFLDVDDAFPLDPNEWSDSDGDTVGDNSDNCLNIPNPSQEDSDSDGIGDACETSSGDTDGDGIDEEFDNCPNTPNSNQIDWDGDGQGDACDSDDDNDGVDDSADKCGETVSWYAEVELKPNHYDSSNWDIVGAYGCSPSQVLYCKPGGNGGEFKFGISQGTKNIWEAQSAWSMDCQINGTVTIEGVSKSLLENTDGDWVPDIIDGDNDGDGVPDWQDDMTEDKDPIGDPDSGIPDWHPKSKHKK